MRLPIAVAASAALLLPVPLPAAAATRTLRVQLSGDPGLPFGVENLAGRMHVAMGGDTVVAIATVHAESEELAQSIRFEQVSSDKGVPTLRVRYPVDRHTTYRYATTGHSSESSIVSFLAGLFGGESGSSIRYDGRRVAVSGTRGVLVYADVAVTLPARALQASFRNVVGPISAEGPRGRLRFDGSSGSLTVRGASGDVVADTGSGDVRAERLEGSFRCNTGSGNCEVSGFRGDALDCNTGSGDVRLDDVGARRIKLGTGSGDVRVRGAEAEELVADTGSGDVEVDVAGAGLNRIKADTGSGDVRLRLAAEAGFVAHASTGSGGVVSGYDDADPIRDGKKVVGYRRGDGRIRIRVDTGSGDVVVEPRR